MATTQNYKVIRLNFKNRMLEDGIHNTLIIDPYLSEIVNKMEMGIAASFIVVDIGKAFGFDTSELRVTPIDSSFA